MILRLSVLAAVALFAAQAQAPSSFPVTISIDASKPIGPMKPIWRMFGADEPNYATMKDGRKLLHEFGSLRPEDAYFRAHNLMTSGDGVPALKWGSTGMYSEDRNGNPIYNWTIIDRIIDTYRAAKMHPYLELGFMPEALSTHPEPYQHEWRPGANYNAIATGWSYPPKDYKKFGDLVYNWVKHCVDRYGRDEVNRWYFEVWNEANISSYWHGTPEEWYKLHDYAVDGVRRALPTARVGGPDVAGSGGKFMQNFLEHVTTGTNFATGRRGTPTDFLSFHAKGAPGFTDGHVRLGIAAQLRTTDAGFALIAASPELKAKPIVIGEFDPDGCAACQGPQLGYRNTTMYSSYVADTYMRALQIADRRGVNLDAALTWAFEFEDQPFFAGQRTLANNGIDLPVMNVFRMFSHMSGERVSATSSAEIPLDAIVRDGVRTAPDVGVTAALDGRKLTVFLWHYHDDDLPGPEAAIELSLSHLPAAAAEARVTTYRIDATHSNAFTVWKGMGSPTAPNDRQYAELLKAGQLATDVTAPATLAIQNGGATLTHSLPRQGVSLLVIEW